MYNSNVIIPKGRVESEFLEDIRKEVLGKIKKMVFEKLQTPFWSLINNFLKVFLN